MPRAFVEPELPGALHSHQPWGLPGIEPPLCEVLTDPIVLAVMWSDGVTLTALNSVIADARRRRQLRSPTSATARGREAEPASSQDSWVQPPSSR
jgi:hypothetical protein